MSLTNKWRKELSNLAHQFSWISKIYDMSVMFDIEVMRALYFKGYHISSSSSLVTLQPI